MRILFAIFVLCLSALLWATVAITRHILRHKNSRKEISMLEAAEPTAVETEPLLDAVISQPAPEKITRQVGAARTFHQD